MRRRSTNHILLNRNCMDREPQLHKHGIFTLGTNITLLCHRLWRTTLVLVETCIYALKFLYFLNFQTFYFIKIVYCYYFHSNGITCMNKISTNLASPLFISRHIPFSQDLLLLTVIFLLRNRKSIRISAKRNPTEVNGNIYFRLHYIAFRKDYRELYIPRMRANYIYNTI